MKKFFALLTLCLLVSFHTAYAFYNPRQGRWLSRDPLDEQGGENLYRFADNNPVSSNDLFGLVTFEQLNEIAKAMGLKPLKTPKKNATRLIQKIQKKVGLRGTSPRANIGWTTLKRVEKWLKDNGKSVRFRDPKTSKQVFDWIVKYWPGDHKMAKGCPFGFGEILALIHYESKDVTAKIGGKPTYFNAIGGPYASRKPRTTAVGLAQFTWDTVPDNSIRYDGEKSVRKALEIIFNDAGRYGKFDEIYIGEKRLFRALDRWEAWHGSLGRFVKEKGKKINELVKQKGDPSKVTKTELDAILEIK